MKEETRFLSSEIKQRAPDYTEPTVGVRAWYVDEDGFLSSTTKRGERWVSGEGKKATCDVLESIARRSFARGMEPPDLRREAAEHVPPQRGCGCGLYAFYDRGRYEEHGDGLSLAKSRVTGVVSAWGEKIILCEYGFRAEYMKLDALMLEEETIKVLGSPVSVREAHEKLARRYGVPLLLPAQVEAFSRERGVVIKRGDLYKAVALIRAIQEWRESEHLCREHRPGSQGGEGGAPAPPEERGAGSA